MSFKEFSESKKYKNFMSKVYGFGATIVLVGALFKLTHWPGANILLTVGLLTEAVIFFFSAFEPAHIEPDWSLVYPELWELYHGEGSPSKAPKSSTRTTTTNPSTGDKLDEMFQNAGITAKSLEKLSEGFNKLGENTEKMAEISNAMAATNNYTKAMNKAAESVNAMESQLSSTANFNATSKKLNDTMVNYIEKVNASVQSTETLNHQMNDLSKRIAAMNNVYGNMLSAMNIKS